MRQSHPLLPVPRRRVLPDLTSKGRYSGIYFILAASWENIWDFRSATEPIPTSHGIFKARRDAQRNGTKNIKPSQRTIHNSGVLTPARWEFVGAFH